jgi:DNA-binding NarL/FixJ family response regulator
LSKNVGTAVLLVSDVRLFREGIALALREQPVIRWVDTAAGQEEAVRHLRTQTPDVVIVDVATPAGFDTIRRVRQSGVDARIVALGIANDETEVLACGEHGVVGYVTRDATLLDLVAAIDAAARDELHCSPSLAAAMFRRLGALALNPPRDHAGARLTPREVEVMGALEQGLSNKAIACQLGIEQATVKNHVHNVLEKLHVHRRSEVAARAHGHRLPHQPETRR